MLHPTPSFYVHETHRRSDNLHSHDAFGTNKTTSWVLFGLRCAKFVVLLGCCKSSVSRPCAKTHHVESSNLSLSMTASENRSSRAAYVRRFAALLATITCGQGASPSAATTATTVVRSRAALLRLRLRTVSCWGVVSVEAALSRLNNTPSAGCRHRQESNSTGGQPFMLSNETWYPWVDTTAAANYQVQAPVGYVTSRRQRTSPSGVLWHLYLL